MELLVRKRASVKSRVTIFAKALDQFDNFTIDNRPPQNLLDDLEHRLVRYELLINEYDTIQGNIECREDCDLEEEVLMRENFELPYFKYLVTFNSI